MNRRNHREQEEVPMVSLTDARSDPGAVMIVHLDARLALPAMEGARWSVHFASATPRDLDLFPVHDSHIGL